MNILDRINELKAIAQPANFSSYWVTVNDSGVITGSYPGPDWDGMKADQVTPLRPVGAVQVTQDDFVKLSSGNFKLQGGQVVPV